MMLRGDVAARLGGPPRLPPKVQQGGGGRCWKGLLFISVVLGALGTGFFLGMMYQSEIMKQANGKGQPTAGTQASIAAAAAVMHEQLTKAADAAVAALNKESAATPATTTPVTITPVKAAPATTTPVTATPASGNVPGAICLNTCSKVKNGQCDDGRAKNLAEGTHAFVFCDLGTDCDDCGPWQPSGPVPWLSKDVVGPIALLQKKGVEVRVKRTKTDPSFTFAYTDPRKDVDVSAHMQDEGGIEFYITKIFYKIFNGRCNAGGKSKLFLDVGANFGYFSIMAASHGCRTLSFEPVPHFYAFLEYNTHINGFASLVQMRSNVVSNEPGAMLTMVAPNKGIWGTAGVNGLNIDKAIPNEGDYDKFTIPAVSLNNEVKEDAILLKVDVEGHEWAVMRGAMEMLKRHNIENIIMEYSPGVPERQHLKDAYLATAQMLMDITNSGFKIGHITDKGGYTHDGTFWSSPLKPMEEVTQTNLAYDIKDALNFQRGNLGEWPDELERVPHWGKFTNAAPEDFYPRSFHSTFGHNTNIWASKNKELLQLDKPVGVLALDAPNNTYFVPQGQETGAGGRICAHIPAEFQVRHRCHCGTPAVCGELQAKLQGLAEQGKLINCHLLPAQFVQAAIKGTLYPLPKRSLLSTGPGGETIIPWGTGWGRAGRGMQQPRTGVASSEGGRVRRVAA